MSGIFNIRTGIIVGLGYVVVSGYNGESNGTWDSGLKLREPANEEAEQNKLQNPLAKNHLLDELLNLIDAPAVDLPGLSEPPIPPKC